MAKRKAACIMVQGTMSGVGKSVLCAGLCRLFAQDGYRVAPFKSQNMALNSYVTADGLEMGRAQVMQAQAAGREPDVRMNPILLKPTSDVGSQVIVGGRVRGNYRAAEYFAMKKQLWPDILGAYQSLAAENDILVIEGAGSPAEINLRADDIVNMGLAERVDAPVLLAGDIDRGGVFAQLYGTMQLLQPDERRRVKGLIVNKFRGDVALLRPGLTQLEQLCGVPVLGVVPYLKVTLDDEDSLAPCLAQTEATAAVDVAVIGLPHISNFTDFTPLSLQPGVSVRYVRAPQALGRPALVVLPGSKNTLADLGWLQESGLAQAVQRLAGQGVPVLGVCGGYQMLGRTVADPDGVEGGGSLPGLGLLPVDTVLAPQKVRTQVQGSTAQLPGFWAALGGASLSGYEIHMGRTEALPGAQGAPFSTLRTADGAPHADGWARGNVAGSYCHGLLEAGDLAPRLAAALRQAAGLPAVPDAGWDYAAFRESQYNALAAALRASLDIPALYACLRPGAEKP